MGREKNAYPELPIWACWTIPVGAMLAFGVPVFLVLNSGGGGFAEGPRPFPGGNQPPIQKGNPPPQPAPDQPPLKPPEPRPAVLPPLKTPPPATQFKGLLAYFPFEDENPGVKVADLANKGNDGRASGAKRVEGIRGRALALLAKDAFFDYGQNPALDFKGPFTLACWIKTGSSAGMLISQRHSKDDGADIDLFLQDGCLHVHVRRDHGWSPVSVECKTAINNGSWHHCALLRSGKDVAIFVDGFEEARSSGDEANGPITTDLRFLGLERRWVREKRESHLGVPRFLNGTVDEFCIFDRALEAKEVRALAGRE